MAGGEKKKIKVEELPQNAWIQYGVVDTDIEVDEETALKILEQLDEEYDDALEFLDILRDGGEKEESGITEDEIKEILQEIDDEIEYKKAYTKLVKYFKQIAKEWVKNKADSVVIWVRWKGGQIDELDHEFNVGICECGEWATWCDACKEYEYEIGYRYGLRKAQEYEW